MSHSITQIARAFKSPPAPVPESPALVRPETWEDVGLLLIGTKQYGYRCFPGHAPAGCTRIVRLFQGDGFADETYDVSFHVHHRPECTCADYVYRRKANAHAEAGEHATTCKHIRAVIALDLHQAPVAVHEVDGVPDLLQSDL